MSTYVVGDLQGCFLSFQRLLEKIRFSSADKLWLVGDLINRGPDSLGVLRWLTEHEHQVTAVLGNHDLHALVVAEGFVKAHRSDTLDALFDAPDADQLLRWLRHQRMAYQQDDFFMVHAGLLPAWDCNIAMALASEVEQSLRGPRYAEFLSHMYGNQPDHWHEDLAGWDRLRVITNAMTRIRICDAQGRMEFAFKGEASDIPDGYQAWYAWPDRASQGQTILFGHWSALGYQRVANTISLDTGCLWGGELSALRLDDLQLFQVPCDAGDQPRDWRHTI
jgi:bis(5'-nucleosyl)-tetraphosphatase (symmetrical)